MSKKTLFHYAAPAIITGMLFATVAISWDEPGSNPPGGNVPAPINISADSQYKEGKLNIGNIQVPDAAFAQLEVRGGGGFRTVGGAVLNTGGAMNGLIVANGNVGIGTTASPQTFLHLVGNAPEYEILIESSSSAAIGLITSSGGAEESIKRIVSASNLASGNRFWIEDSITLEKIILSKEVGSEYYVGIGNIENPTQKLEVDGGIRLNTTNPRPACNATTTRGTLWFTEGAPDILEVCIFDGVGYTWKAVW